MRLSRSVPRSLALVPLVAGLLVSGLGFLPATSGAAGAATSGTFRYWAEATQGGTSNLIITGSIGDYGKSFNVNAQGKDDSNGNYELVKLQHGTFLFNKTNFDEADSKTNFPINKTTCSAGGSVTGTATIVSGTGEYKGITGTLTITLSDSWVISDTTKCSGSNKILDQYAYVSGTGTASY